MDFVSSRCPIAELSWLVKRIKKSKKRTASQYQKYQDIGH